MISNAGQHLTCEELIQNLVDSTDVEPVRRAHLQSCYHCRNQAAVLEQRYLKLGQAARRLAPHPTRPFRLPDTAGVKRRRPLQPVMAMGFAAALILAIMVFRPHVIDPARRVSQVTAYNTEEDQQLMAQVDSLVEDALPKAYQRLLVVNEPVLTDELIDWIVPPVEADEDARSGLETFNRV